MSQGSKVEFTDLPWPAAACHQETVFVDLVWRLLCVALWLHVHGVGPGIGKRRREGGREERGWMNSRNLIIWRDSLQGCVQSDIQTIINFFLSTIIYFHHLYLILANDHLLSHSLVFSFHGNNSRQNSWNQPWLHIAITGNTKNTDAWV